MYKVADYKGNVNHLQSNFLKNKQFSVQHSCHLSIQLTAIFRLQVIQSNIQHIKRYTVS